MTVPPTRLRRLFSSGPAIPRVRSHRQANAGQARAKNRAIELSRGRFVAFLDADDVWNPDKLAQQMPLFRGRPELGVVYSDYQCMDAEGFAAR